MSNRTLVELNHDYCPHNNPEALQKWAYAMSIYMSSGDQLHLPDGVTFKGMHHHSDPDPLAELTRLQAEVERLPQRIRDWFESWRPCDCGKDDGRKYSTKCGHAVSCDMYVCEELIRALASPSSVKETKE